MRGEKRTQQLSTVRNFAFGVFGPTSSRGQGNRQEMDGKFVTSGY
jgi:hypothetical protein